MADRSDRIERLWGELSGSLHDWFERRTGDPHLAEDLVQEAFLRVHDRIDALSDEDRLAAWIQTVARNLLIDWRRRRRPEALDAKDGDPADTSNEEGQGVDAIVASWLEPTLDELTETDRETLRLTELVGLTQGQAAERLGISLAAVKSRVLRGRERLRERVLACCELEFDRRGGIVAYRERSKSSDCCDS